MVVESDLEDKGDAVTIPSPPSLGDQTWSAIHNANLGKLTGVHGQSTGVEYTPFILYVPGNPKLEPYDDCDVPPPLVQHTNDDDNSDDERDDKRDIVIGEIDIDDNKILEEVPSEGCGHTAQTRPTYYNTDFSNIKYK